MCRVKVNAEKKAEIKPGMTGLFFEDINYGADGGIYCEMLENYNFEALCAVGDFNDYRTTYDGLYGWEAYPCDGMGAMLETVCEGGVSSVNPHYLSFTASDIQTGFSNKAYDGIFLTQGEQYKISLYIRRQLDYDGAVYALIDDWGEEIQRIELLPKEDMEEAGENIKNNDFSRIIKDAGNGWKKVEAVFNAKENIIGGVFAIALEHVGRAEFDFISLKPVNAVLGIFRRDLAEKLRELKPGFLRFPGGCIVEGNNLANRYQWKNSVGKPEDRKNNWNRWAVHGNNRENGFVGQYCNYNQTLGLGYYEYFLLCEYLQCRPLPVANVGLACQYQSLELVDMKDEHFQDYIQDVLDLIEFANGDENTKWGGVRCEMGHREPFGLKMIGIGNEQWETEEVHFFDRYDAFERAIHERYPDMLLIGSAGPDVTSDHYRDAWKFYREKGEKLKDEIEKYVYAVDEHYYQKPEWMLANSHFYDDYPRDIKVFAGEYATHVVPGSFNNPSSNNLYAALCEAAFMTGLERNGDVVVMASYAPLLARVGYTQWSPDMIWFDGQSSYATPSYYVQQMYSLYKGKYVLDMEIPEGLYGVSSFDDENNKIYIKLVNVTEKDMEISIDAEDILKKNGIEGSVKAREIILTGADREDFNTVEEPEKIKPYEREIILGETYILKKNSFAVLVI